MVPKISVPSLDLIFTARHRPRAHETGFITSESSCDELAAQDGFTSTG
jgi:hypothetical protein